jgi:hypothetical protein
MFLAGLIFFAPTTFVTENPEISEQSVENQSSSFFVSGWKSFKDDVLKFYDAKTTKKLSSSSQENQTFFRNYKIYESENISRNISIENFLLYPSGNIQKKPFAAVGFITDMQTCFNVDSFVWSGASFENFSNMPTDLNAILKNPLKFQIKNILTKPLLKNTLQIQINANENIGKRIQVLAESFYLKEILNNINSEEFGVRSSSSQYTCASQIDKNKALHPKNSHRIFEKNFLVQSQKQWPNFLSVSDGKLFEGYSNAIPLVVSSGSVQSVSEKFIENIKSDVPKILNLLHDLKPTQAVVLKVVGKFALISRGRAFGYSIGTRLVSEKNKAKMHIVKYAEEGPDTSWALMRTKNEIVKQGDLVDLEP